jgi:hypothetical protein
MTHQERKNWRMASHEMKTVVQERIIVKPLLLQTSQYVLGARETNEKWLCPALLCGTSIPHSHYLASKSTDFDLIATGASRTFMSLSDLGTSSGIPVTIRLQNTFNYPLNRRVPFQSEVSLADGAFCSGEWNKLVHLETQSVALLGPSLIESLQQDSIYPAKTISMVSKIATCTAPLTALSGKEFPQLGRIAFESATTTVAVIVLFVVCLLCVLIWNQTKSISQLLTEQQYRLTQSSADEEAVEVPRGVSNKKWKRRRATRRIWHHRLARLSLTVISLLAMGASSQLLKDPTVPSNASPLHSSRALTGTLGV